MLPGRAARGHQFKREMRRLLVNGTQRVCHEDGGYIIGHGDREVLVRGRRIKFNFRRDSGLRLQQ